MIVTLRIPSCSNYRNLQPVKRPKDNGVVVVVVNMLIARSHYCRRLADASPKNKKARLNVFPDLAGFLNNNKVNRYVLIAEKFCTVIVKQFGQNHQNKNQLALGRIRTGL